MVEGETCQFTCDVPNIAPVQNLTVKWYKGDAMIHEDTFKNVGAGKKPVNQSPVLNFTATRQDNGLTVRCEAHLDLRPNGPQLNASSQELKVTVHCKYIVCVLTSLQCGQRDLKCSNFTSVMLGFEFTGFLQSCNA